MKLYFINGPRKGQDFELKPPEVTLGRETDNTINLLVGGVSRYHCKIEFRDNSWFIEDLGSTNGVKINGERISEPRKLNVTDHVNLGDQDITIKDNSARDESAGSATPVPIFSPIPDSKQPGENPEKDKKGDITSAAETFIKPPAPSVSPTARTIPDVSDTENGGEPKDFFGSLNVDSTGNDENAPAEENILSKINFFGGNAGKKVDLTDGSGKNGKKHASFLFYITVIGMAIIFLSVFIIMEKESSKKNIGRKTASAKKAEAPLLLVYKKQIIRPNNIFYFSLHLENNSAEFTIDDLKTGQHYSKFIEKVDKTSLRDLEHAIKNTSFMTLLPNAAPGSARPESIRTLIIACDGDMNKITVRDDYASTSFEQIEVAIDDFAAQYDLRTISLTPEELKEEAEKAFYKAEDLFENYEARPENLRKAIERYKITVDFLDCFSPKPKMWDIARKKEQQARALLDERIKNLDFDFRRAMRLNQLETSLELAGQMLKTAYPDSRDYKKYENVKLKLEAKIRRMKRK